MNKIDSNLLFTMGAPVFDSAFGEGLPVAALHEVHSASPGDFSTAAAFTLLTAQRARSGHRPFLWISEDRAARRLGQLYAPAIIEFGINPDNIIHAAAPDPLAALRVAADAGRSAALAGVILSLSGKNPRGLDMTATRRLSLFARESKLPVFLLREGAAQMPSAAYSRWEIASAASHALEANAPGHPVFDVTLLRHRRGIEGLAARLEWDREDRRFAAHTGAVPAVPGIRADFGGADIGKERKRA